MKILIMMLLSFSISAKVVETEKSFSIDFTSNQDAKMFFTQLNVPIDFGTFQTGKKHSYKLFQDADKNFSFYCAEMSKNDFQCVFTINKNLTGDKFSIENDDFQIHLMTTDYDLSKKLFDSLNVMNMQHGNYIIKVMEDNLSTFGVSCIVDTNTYADYRCDIRIFK